MNVQTLIIFVLLKTCLGTFLEYEEDRKFPFWFPPNPRPSPIDLIRAAMDTKKSWKPLRFSPEHSVNLRAIQIPKTDGLEVRFEHGKIPSISDGLLKGTYAFEKLFFHCGTNGSDRGSLHAIEGKYFPVEMHAYYKLVPVESFDFGFFTFIFGKKIESTVIISQFFELNESDNLNIASILDNSATSLDKSIPPLIEYVSYKGSLIISPFTEDVHWLISLNPQKISKAQVEKLQKTHNISHIARPLQPWYDRKVYFITS